jgi:hypothetical protein
MSLASCGRRPQTRIVFIAEIVLLSNGEIGGILDGRTGGTLE